MRVHVLPREVVEKIAAGEVIERPAAVVKELVENSIDAGATRVIVETEGGGKRRVRVIDDGTGMTAEEARLAIRRHATSKLRQAADLFAIRTLGFRGEALPSIGAVARLELLTRMEGEEAGTRLIVEGGRLIAEEAAPSPVGTSVTVTRLFFNTPVRQKFLRSDAAEASQITELIQRLAVAHHRISFRLVQEERQVAVSPGSDDPFNALLAVWGRPVARDLLRVETAASGVGRGSEAAPSVTGFVGRPVATRANRQLQWFYVNGRFVRSPLFYRALDEAYRASMPQGRYPLAVLFLQIDPAAVDVNVHPSKIEVRFRDEAAVYDAILAAVRAALGQKGPTSEWGVKQKPAEFPNTVREAAAVPYAYAGPESATPVEVPLLDAEAVESPLLSNADAPPDDRPMVEEAPPAAPRWDGTLPFAEAALGPGGWGRRAPGEPPPARPHSPPRIPPPAPPAARASDVSPERTAGAQPSSTAPTPGIPAPGIPELVPVGQVRDLFLLASGEGRLWIVDQHVAHERILFERLADPAGRESAEPLLLPLTLPLDQRQALVLEDHRGLLGEMGFVIEPFGDNSYLVRAVPISLVGKNYEQVLRDMVDEMSALSEGGRVHLQREQVAMAAAGRACKAALKAGKTLSDAEMARLLADLSQTRNPYTCPHGRPIFLTFDEKEIAALFGETACG